MVTAALDEATLSLVHQFQTLAYVSIILVTLFFYDYLTALKREVSSIWLGKWTTLNILYLLSRYIPFVNFINMVITMSIDLDLKLCMPMFYFSMWTAMIGTTVGEACFYLRAYALWGRSRNAAIFLIMLFSAMVIAGFTVNSVMAASATVVQLPNRVPALKPQCIVHLEPKRTNYAIAGWIIIVVVDTVLVSMIIYARTRMYRSTIPTQNNLLNRIYRDAIGYFLCNFLISVTSIIFYLFAPGPIKMASTSYSLMMLSMLSCKIMLRLRDYGNSHLLNQDIGSMSTDIALSSIRFRSTNVCTSPEEC